MSDRQSSRLAWGALVVILLVNTALLLVVWWQRPELPAALTESSDGVPIGIRPQPATVSGSTATLVEVNLQDSVALVAPDWAGIITSTYVGGGATVTSGDPFVAVNGIDVVALATPTPFFRPLELGSTGADVRQLETVLQSLGIEVGALDGSFDSVLASAVEQFNALRGVAGSPRFDHSSVVWLPEAIVTLEAIELRPGVPAPSLGQVIATTVSAVEAASLIDPTLISAIARDYVIDVQGTIVPVEIDGSVPDDSVALLDIHVDELNEQSQLDVTLRFEQPIAGLAVPGSALIPGDSGFCVYVLTDTGPGSAIPVELIDASLGRTIVAGSLDVEAQVWVNPGADAEC